jgi:hypothetical protein
VVKVRHSLFVFAERARESVVSPFAAATLFDSLDERSFAYLLPLSSSEALLESATFDSAIHKEDETPLLQYLRSREPPSTSPTRSTAIYC